MEDNMEVEILMFLPLCQKDKKGTVSEPSGYAVIREKAKPYGLQSPYRHATMEGLCEHITAQLHQGESFDLEALRAALSRREMYAVSVDRDIADRFASQPV
jgi:hypothetical protein